MKRFLLAAVLALAVGTSLPAAPVAATGDDTELALDGMKPDQQLRVYTDVINSLITNGGLGDSPLTKVEMDDDHNSVVMYMYIDDAEVVQALNKYPEMAKQMILQEMFDDGDMKDFANLLIASGRDFDIFVTCNEQDVYALLTFSPAEFKESLKL